MPHLVEETDATLAGVWSSFGPVEMLAPCLPLGQRAGFRAAALTAVAQMML